jgi:hypothetical protein
VPEARLEGACEALSLGLALLEGYGERCICQPHWVLNRSTVVSSDMDDD